MHRGRRRPSPSSRRRRQPRPARTAHPRAPPRRERRGPEPAPRPLAPDPAEAVIQGVEPGAEIGFWTFYLSPTFDQYIKDTIARFEATYPGRQGQLGGPPGHVQGRPEQRVRRRQRARRHQPLGQRGLGQRVRRQGPPAAARRQGPGQAVKDIYFPGLWKEQLIDGVNYQFPWYQGLNVELINKAIFDKAGVTVADFPKTIDGLPALCDTILDKTGTVCDIRLTGQRPARPDGLRGQRQGPQRRRQDVHVRLARGRRVAADVRRHGQGRHRGQHRPHHHRRPRRAQRLHRGHAAVLRDRPQPGPHSQGPERHPVRQPGDGPGAARQEQRQRQGPDVASRSRATPSSRTPRWRSPSSSPTRGPWSTSPSRSRSTRRRRRPTTTRSSPTTPSAIEDSARPLAKDIISTYADIVPTIPNKADVNEIVLKAVESALFSGVDAQQALSDAVQKANASLK